MGIEINCGGVFDGETKERESCLQAAYALMNWVLSKAWWLGFEVFQP